MTNILRKIDISTITNKISIQKMKTFVVNNLPNIFSSCAVASICGAVFLTAKGMHKADDILYTEMSNRIIESGETCTVEEALVIRDEFSLEDKVKLVWRQFVPAGLATVSAVMFVIASNRAGHEQYMALLSAYKLGEEAFKNYKDSAADILGEEKAEEVENRFYAKKAASAALRSNVLIPNVDGSENPTLFVESLTGTPFYANVDTVYHALNFVNHELNKWNAVSINEFLDDIGVDTKHILAGNNLVWEIDPHSVGLVDLRFFHEFFCDDEAMPCTVIAYNVDPEYERRYSTAKKRQ